MKKTHWLVLLFALLLAVGFVGCEGEQGPQGPEGPQGPAGPEGPAGPGAVVPEYTYLGNGGEDCMHCHASTVTSWDQTRHSEAYADLVAGGSDNDPYCLQCHTTGWDAPVAHGDTTVTDHGADHYGFDDYFQVEGDTAAMRRHALENVQCEACHGPMGPDFNAHKPRFSLNTTFDAVNNTSESLCFPCHRGQMEEWVDSGHARASLDMTPAEFTDEWGRSSCNPCHTSDGFVKANDPAFADYEMPEVQSYIGCVTCHDPHGGGNTYQLRNVGAVPVVYHPGLEDGDPNVPEMSGHDAGQVCAQCHHARRDADNVAGQIAGGSPHFGPHRSPQMDMYLGVGSYEIDGYDYADSREHSHQNIEEACVKCHMQRKSEVHGQLQDHSFHTFTPVPVDPDGNGTGNCEPCHSTDTFDINGLQTEIHGKMDTLAQALGYADAADMEANWDTDNVADDFPTWKREAGYAFYFVFDDGSYGVHNPNYATALLDNAIAYAQAQQ